MTKLCSCCKDHLTGDDPNIAMDRVVKCVECGEDCQCEGCAVEQNNLVGRIDEETQEFLDNQTKFRYEQERYRRGF